MTNAGRVDMSDFQLLKVLGTGGKFLASSLVLSWLEIVTLSLSL